MTGKDIFRELGGLEADLVLSAAPDVPKRRPIYKTLIACAAALALLVGCLSIIGFDNVYASISKIFTFIPGVGIQERDDSALYTWEPVTGKVESTLETDRSYAEIWRASYQDGVLTVTVHIDGKEVYPDNLKLYRNSVLLDSDCFAHVSADDCLMELTVSMDTPVEGDFYEVSVLTFIHRLSFTMKPCESMEQLAQIGPTATVNDISLTVTANRIGNELILWYYEFKHPNATSDRIAAFGHAAAGAWKDTRYVETENGRLTDKGGGLSLYNRDVYEISDEDQTATLHIPYLDMFHKEEGQLQIPFPMEYGSFSSDSAMESELGKIQISQIDRRESQEAPGMDEIILYFAFESKDENKRLHSFNYDHSELDCINYSAICWDEDAVIETLVLIVEPSREEITLNVSSVYYYLMGEYVIPLDIKG